MRECGIHPKVIRAGKANMFLSDVFIESFANSTGVPVELYNCDGSVGAALGAGIGVGIFKTEAEAFNNAKLLKLVEPEKTDTYNSLYEEWKEVLLNCIN